MLSEIQDALESHVALLPGETTIQWGAYDPDPSTPWILASMPGIDRQPMGINRDTLFWRRGTLELVVKQPFNDGLAPLLLRVEGVLRHFPRGKTLQSGAATVIVEDAGDMAEIRTADWRSIPVRIRWNTTEKI